MRLVKRKIKLPVGEKSATVVAISDVHYGNRFHDSVVFEYWIQWLRDNPDSLILLLGDLIEGKTKDSVGFYDQVIEIDDQIDYIVNVFSEFKDRIIALTGGNHELSTWKATGHDIAKSIARRLDVPYLNNGGWVYITIEGEKQKQIYRIYLTHGASGATTAGGRINAVMRLKNITRADLYLHAHMHALLHEKESVYVIENASLKLKEVHYVVTGSYLEYLGSYGQMKSYAPSGVSGSPKIKLHADLNRISVSL
ncbi:MAG: hypothetical protein GY853_16445 [PVC group bacterium]|nr:hypothetical protein [PVC group bacterium]